MVGGGRVGRVLGCLAAVVNSAKKLIVDLRGGGEDIPRVRSQHSSVPIL